MEGPETFEKSWNPKDREIARFYAGYQAALKEASALDFDDLLLEDGELFDRGAVAARALLAEVPVRHGRRIPGHEPAAVSADQAAGQPASRTWPSSAIPTSRSTSGAAPTCGTSSISKRTFPKPRSSGSSGTTGRRRSSSTRRPRSSPTTATARRRRCGRIGRAARRSSTFAAATSSKKPTTSRVSRAQTLSEDVAQHDGGPLSDQRAVPLGRRRACGRRASATSCSAASGSTSARKSRTRSGISSSSSIPYDDVALRRVINVPTRGIGKGVMDALEQINLDGGRHTMRRRCSPGCSRHRVATRSGRSSMTALDRRLLNAAPARRRSPRFAT